MVYHRRPKNVAKFRALQARAPAYYVNNTLALALAVHEMSRHFWAAYGSTGCIKKFTVGKGLLMQKAYTAFNKVL